MFHCAVGHVAFLLRSFTTNQRAAHLYIHEHSIKDQVQSTRGEQHLGHFQPNQCYIPYLETLRNSVKYPKTQSMTPLMVLANLVLRKPIGAFGCVCMKRPASIAACSRGGVINGSLKSKNVSFYVFGRLRCCMVSSTPNI